MRAQRCCPSRCLHQQVPVPQCRSCRLPTRPRRRTPHLPYVGDFGPNARRCFVRVVVRGRLVSLPLPTARQRSQRTQAASPPFPSALGLAKPGIFPTQRSLFILVSEPSLGHFSASSILAAAALRPVLQPLRAELTWLSRHLSSRRPNIDKPPTTRRHDRVTRPPHSGTSTHPRSPWGWES